MSTVEDSSAQPPLSNRVFDHHLIYRMPKKAYDVKQTDKFLKFKQMMKEKYC